MVGRQARRPHKTHDHSLTEEPSWKDPLVSHSFGEGILAHTYHQTFIAGAANVVPHHIHVKDADLTGVHAKAVDLLPVCQGLELRPRTGVLGGEVVYIQGSRRYPVKLPMYDVVPVVVLLVHVLRPPDTRLDACYLLELFYAEEQIRIADQHTALRSNLQTDNISLVRVLKYNRRRHTSNTLGRLSVSLRATVFSERIHATIVSSSARVRSGVVDIAVSRGVKSVQGDKERRSERGFVHW